MISGLFSLSNERTAKMEFYAMANKSRQKVGHNIKIDSEIKSKEIFFYSHADRRTSIPAAKI